METKIIELIANDHFLTLPPSGCHDCPFAGESYDVNWGDPDEGYYHCNLLNLDDVWGESPKCTRADWMKKAAEELSRLNAKISDSETLKVALADELEQHLETKNQLAIARDLQISLTQQVTSLELEIARKYSRDKSLPNIEKLFLRKDKPLMSKELFDVLAELLSEVVQLGQNVSNRRWNAMIEKYRKKLCGETE